ncbi:MAG: hypothetical protein AB7U75_14350 [Hyphomicrobiaceae bacterium]
MRDFAYNAQRDSITVHFLNGDAFTWPKTHSNFAEVKQAIIDGADAARLRQLMDIIGQTKAAVESAVVATEGQVTVTRDGVTYKGKPLDMPVCSRIMEFAAEGFPVEPLLRFTERLLKNARREAVLSLYDFLDANSIPITDDGFFIVYKRVRGDYKDIHSGTFDNSVGQAPRVEAWEVEANRDQTCAKGLHVCARHYLPSFGAGEGNRVVICKVDPADVVAVPRDYNNSKMRVCGYEVIGELDSAAVAEVLDTHRIVNPNTKVEGANFGDNFEVEDDDDDYGYEDDYDNTCDCGRDEEDCTWPDCHDEPEDEPASEPEPVKKSRFSWFGRRS